MRSYFKEYRGLEPFFGPSRGISYGMCLFEEGTAAEKWMTLLSPRGPPRSNKNEKKRFFGQLPQHHKTCKIAL